MEKELEIERNGINFDKVIKALMDADKRGEKVYFYWNGVKLHSEGMTEEKAYMDAYRTPKEEFDKMYAAIEKNKKESKEKALLNAEEWIKEGEKLIYPERQKEWEECVYKRIDDIYNGKDIEAALEIMKKLDQGYEIDEIKEIIKNQNHSGASESIVRNIILNFSKRGPEFFKETTPILNSEIEDKIRQIEEQNNEYKNNNQITM